MQTDIVTVSRTAVPTYIYSLGLLYLQLRPKIVTKDSECRQISLPCHEKSYLCTGFALHATKSKRQRLTKTVNADRYSYRVTKSSTYIYALGLLYMQLKSKYSNKDSQCRQI